MVIPCRSARRAGSTLDRARTRTAELARAPSGCGRATDARVSVTRRTRHQHRGFDDKLLQVLPCATISGTTCRTAPILKRSARSAPSFILPGRGPQSRTARRHLANRKRTRLPPARRGGRARTTTIAAAGSGLHRIPTPPRLSTIGARGRNSPNNIFGGHHRRHSVRLDEVFHGVAFTSGPSALASGSRSRDESRPRA